MKALIVYYSMEGHTKLIAEMIAAETGGELCPLNPVKALDKTGFSKYLWGGKSVIFNEKPQLQNPLPQLDNYDLIFIGTPIWASSFTPPVNTYLAEHSFTGKKVMLFACHAGGGAKKCFMKMKARLTGNTILGEIDFKVPKEEDREFYNRQIKKWLLEAGL